MYLKNENRNDEELKRRHEQSQELTEALIAKKREEKFELEQDLEKLR